MQKKAGLDHVLRKAETGDSGSPEGLGTLVLAYPGQS